MNKNSAASKNCFNCLGHVEGCPAYNGADGAPCSWYLVACSDIRKYNAAQEPGAAPALVTLETMLREYLAATGREIKNMGEVKFKNETGIVAR